MCGSRSWGDGRVGRRVGEGKDSRRQVEERLALRPRDVAICILAEHRRSALRPGSRTFQGECTGSSRNEGW